MCNSVPDHVVEADSMVQNWSRKTNRNKNHIGLLTTEVKHLKASETSPEFEILFK